MAPRHPPRPDRHRLQAPADTEGVGRAAPPTATDPRSHGRARLPDRWGSVDRAGIPIAWEIHGDRGPAILCMPTWSIVSARIWKMQVPFLARDHRVITFDPRGNGRSGRPTDPAAYAETEFVRDALAVLDATDTSSAVVVSLSLGAQRALLLAAEHPGRVTGLVLIAPSVPLGAPVTDRVAPDPDGNGWSLYTHESWRTDLPRFLRFFFGRCFTEPHSTRAIEEAVAWGMGIPAESLVASDAATRPGRDGFLDACARVRCPSLVIQGSDDAVTGPDRGIQVARTLGAELLIVEGGGHIPNVREPVVVDLAIREFVARCDTGGRPARSTTDPGGAQAPTPPATTRIRRRGLGRERRMLMVSSPIGLGHARRDLAIASELRRLRPDLRIDWLAQHPVTTVLEAAGERIHPASGLLASESAHITAESSGHDLHAFQAIRRMDEILLANFLVFHDVVEAEQYDLVVADEAWDIDHHLHEQPELKRSALVWMTDFVGWLPMTSGGAAEALLTTDYNAEMIEHIDRYPRLRDRSVFVGDPDDIVADSFGPGLPDIRDWTEQHFRFSGYITGFDPAPLIEGREAIRRELGYHPDERVVLVAVGGSGVGEAMLRRVAASREEIARSVPGVRLCLVAGPRIDPRSLPVTPDVEVRGHVPDLYRHLAAADLAVVQGGLTTTMELAAVQRPFVYIPLADHFEQTRHVAHRLERYRAGRRLDFADATPDAIADAIATEIDRVPDTLPVASDAAARAAGLIAELL
ncbi:MAG: alpha/beta fold hydrolase [Chloroflexi bacterium]|nr:alpha/beta fold hydrolase [Chloroflexota bacterium]